MDNLQDFPHHPVLEELSEVLCVKTGRDAPAFFRILTLYYLGVMASCMRAQVVSPAFKTIPVNCYVTALAPSGFGKGLSTGTLRDDIMIDFRKSFRDFVLPMHAEKNMATLASRFAALSGRTEDHEREKLEKDFASCGEYPFAFDGGSEAALKQIRHLLLMAECGSLNLEIDEIGTNLEKASTVEAMAVYLELYDTGHVNNKIKVNGADSKRTKEIDGFTPANMLLFGTQDKLFDGNVLEKKWYSLLDTGFARRGNFAWADQSSMMSESELTVDEIYDRLTNPVNDGVIEKWRQHFAGLADPSKIGWTIETTEAVDKLLIQYRLRCEAKAKALGNYAGSARYELEHRHSRALKVAGSLAFVDESLILTEDHVKAAIKVVEESGQAFEGMMNQEPAHAKLARYIAASDKEISVSELHQKLPFFKAASKSDRNEFLTLATSWGYDNHIILKTRWQDKVELHSGEALKEVDLDNLSLSHSHDFAHHYEFVSASFEDLEELAMMPNHNWTNHAFVDGHRCEDKSIPGFELLVFDIDGTVSLNTCHALMEDYAFMTYTTKRHTAEANRFRLVMPMNFQLKLDGADYRELYHNVRNWLPFEVDETTADRCRKWATYDTAQCYMHRDGQLLDVLPFIPRTTRNQEREQGIKELGSLDNLERWFNHRISVGNRNNNMRDFALALVDSGMDYNEVEKKVLAFNSRISNGLAAEELQRTVLVTAAKKAQNRSA